MKPILCLNQGSSSLRYATFEVDGETEIENGHFSCLESHHSEGFQNALKEAVRCQPGAVGYRVVHGGDLYIAPTIITDEVLEELRSLKRLAPEHLPAAIEAIETTRRCFPEISHVACFDTAFHQNMPEHAKRFALPGELWDEGVRRYGFHGLSFEFVVESLGKDLPERTIVAHLGNGSSMVALLGGRSVETTMGMTPAGGMMMGSRSGDLDPGILIHLLREKKMTPEQLSDLVNQNSGLKGVSGLTSDMRTLLERSGTNQAAALAIEMYCYHARKQIGALAAVLGGVDLLVFTGGIGENAEPIRQGIVQGLDFLRSEIRVVPTNEAKMVARHVAAIVRS
ncbi:MAG: acetate kinase [Verrucomicrobiales bacterium]